MRRGLAAAFLLFASACGGGGEGARDEQGAESATDAAGPDVAPTAAPGVAFNYSYDFRLPFERIAEVQEQHAQACEALGVNRCRISSMFYRVTGREEIEGRVAFKLEPSLARRFGKHGVDLVLKAEGMLERSEITGTDVGTGIAAAGRTQDELRADLARIERQLAEPNMPGEERAQLQVQAQQLRDAIRAAGQVRTEGQEMLAVTPVVFNYGSGDLVPGFDRPFRDALRRAGDNLVQGTAWLFVLVVTLLPWILAALGGWWLWRKIRRRFFPAHDESEAAAAPIPQSPGA